MTDDAIEPRLCLGRVVLDYQALDVGDLLLEAGDVVVITRSLGKEWFYGHVNGTPETAGIFPSSVVEVIQGSVVQPGPLILAKAIPDRPPPRQQRASEVRVGFGVMPIRGKIDYAARHDEFSDTQSSAASPEPSPSPADSSRGGRSSRARRDAVAASALPMNTPGAGAAAAAAAAAAVPSSAATAPRPESASRMDSSLWSLASRTSALGLKELPAYHSESVAAAAESAASAAGASAAPGAGEAVMRVSLPFAERKMTLDGELRSVYTIDIATSHRLARLEKRFSELRAADVQLRAIFPDAFANAAAPLSADGALASAAAAAAAAAASPSPAGQPPLVDVSLQDPSLMVARRTSGGMEARRLAAQRYLQLAMAHPPLAALILAFLIGPLPLEAPAAADAVADAAASSFATPVAAASPAAAAASARLSRAASSRLLTRTPAVYSTRTLGALSVRMGASPVASAAGSSRRMVPSVSISAVRNPGLPPLLPAAAASASGVATGTTLSSVQSAVTAATSGALAAVDFPATIAATAAAVAAAEQELLGQSQQQQQQQWSTASATAAAAVVSSPSAPAAPVAVAAAACADDAVSLPPVHPLTIAYSSAEPAGASVPFTLESLDAFDQLLERGWAIIDPATDDVLPETDAQKAEDDAAGCGDAVWDSQTAAALQLQVQAAAAATAPPATDEPAAAAAAAASAGVASDEPAPPPLCGQQVTISFARALVWDGASSAGVVLEGVTAARFHLGDRRESSVIPQGLHAALRRIPAGRAAGPLTVVLGPDAAFGQAGRPPLVPQAAHIVYCGLRLHGPVRGPPRPMPSAAFGREGGASAMGDARLGTVVAPDGTGIVDDAMLALAQGILGDGAKGGGGGGAPSGSRFAGRQADQRTVTLVPAASNPASAAPSVHPQSSAAGSVGVGDGSMVSPGGFAPRQASGGGGFSAGAILAGTVAPRHLQGPPPPSPSFGAGTPLPPGSSGGQGLKATVTAGGGILMPSPEEAERAMRAWLASMGEAAPPPLPPTGATGSKSARAAAAGSSAAATAPSASATHAAGGGGFFRGLFSGRTPQPSVVAAATGLSGGLSSTSGGGSGSSSPVMGHGGRGASFSEAPEQQQDDAAVGVSGPGLLSRIFKRGPGTAASVTPSSAPSQQQQQQQQQAQSSSQTFTRAGVGRAASPVGSQPPLLAAATSWDGTGPGASPGGPSSVRPAATASASAAAAAGVVDDWGGPGSRGSGAAANEAAPSASSSTRR